MNNIIKIYKQDIKNIVTNYAAFITIIALCILPSMYALYDNHKMVGFMELEKKNEFNYELGKFTVLYEARHLGYGKALLDFAKNKVKELGGEKLIISVIENNDILKDWYRANGFIHTDTKKVKHLPFSVDLMESNL